MWLQVAPPLGMAHTWSNLERNDDSRMTSARAGEAGWCISTLCGVLGVLCGGVSVRGVRSVTPAARVCNM